jgi:hypothetical protein
MQKRSLGAAMLVLAFGCASLVAPPTAAAQDQVLASGKFRGQSGHATSGGVSVVKTATGYVVVLEPDFKFDGAPDPKLGFGRGGYDKSTQFSELRSNSGRQSYEISSTIDPSAYTEVWVWCEKFSVPLGVAKLK